MKNEMNVFNKKKHKRAIRKSGYVQWLGSLPKHFLRKVEIVEPYTCNTLAQHIIATA